MKLKNKISAAAVRLSEVGLMLAVGTGMALASSGGPFGTISTFVENNFLPAIGTIGVVGGIGYGAIHAFKHDYGRAVVGLGTATGGGIVAAQSSWFSQQAGVSAATIGQHVAAHAATLASMLHSFGL